MIKWEYLTIQDSSYSEGFAGKLNGLGREGWELIVVMNGMFYLKRPILEQT